MGLHNSFKVSFVTPSSVDLDKITPDMFTKIEWDLSDQFMGNPRAGNVGNLQFEDLVTGEVLQYCPDCKKPSIFSDKDNNTCNTCWNQK